MTNSDWMWKTLSRVIRMEKPGTSVWFTRFTGQMTFRDLHFSKQAMRMLNTPNAGGSSIVSEVLSFEVISRYLRAKLYKMETEIEYFPKGGPMTDYLSPASTVPGLLAAPTPLGPPPRLASGPPRSLYHSLLQHTQVLPTPASPAPSLPLLRATPLAVHPPEPTSAPQPSCPPLPRPALSHRYLPSLPAHTSGSSQLLLPTPPPSLLSASTPTHSPRTPLSPPSADRLFYPQYRLLLLSQLVT
ncbi:hypothetical protein FGIG_10114 [Fasciola gigantica]|uniref:Uncharacterized protein n=1 Tax=Fasciola gigantica TaxID=46835 RepID=A0A504YUH7_FASGI|nr:hypothetical protein FGIG_10114 [Fasciola gigantica]